METNRKTRLAHLAGHSAIALAAATLCGGAAAFDLKVNDDITGSWNNTIRYNVGIRAQQRDPIIGNSPNYDEGDYSYNRGQVVTNRVDLLSELAMDYKRQLGFRLSGAAWYDAAFHDEVRTNPALSAQGSYNNNQFSNTTKRFYKGPSGEFLDAYAYGNFKLGEVPVNASLGQQTVLWGEAIFAAVHSVSYSQSPSDLRKLLANPGATAKETSLPVTQAAVQANLTPQLSVAGQYYLDWRPTRFPEGGTYLGGLPDWMVSGPDRFAVAPGAFLNNEGNVKPRRSGDWGVNARWSPQWLDGTIGVYAREYTERNFWLNVTPATGSYRFAYASPAHLYGISLSKQVAGLSLGSELVWRRDTALQSTATDANLNGARGNTMHALVNAIQSFGPGPLWDSAILLAELAYNRLNSVTSNQALFNGCATGNLDARTTGCATKNFTQFHVVFSPTWNQVAPGLDVTATASLVNYGIKGNSAVLLGGNEGSGIYGLAVALDYNQKHNLRVAYNGYMAKYASNGTSIATSNGLMIQDRGWVSLTYTTNF